MGQHAASIEEFPYQIQLVFIKEHLRPALLHTSINTAIFMLLPSPLPLSPSRFDSLLLPHLNLVYAQSFFFSFASVFLLILILVLLLNMIVWVWSLWLIRFGRIFYNWNVVNNCIGFELPIRNESLELDFLYRSSLNSFEIECLLQ